MRLQIVKSDDDAEKVRQESCVHIWQLVELRKRFIDREGAELDPPDERRLERCKECGLSRWR